MRLAGQAVSAGSSLKGLFVCWDGRTIFEPLYAGFEEVDKC